MKRVAQTIRRSAMAIVLAGAGLLGSGAAHADCGISSTGTTSSTVLYDPFNPSGLQPTQITLTLQRYNPPGAEFTQYISFYLKAATPDANGTIVIPLSYVGQSNVAGLGSDVFYGTNETPPIITPNTVPTSGANFLRVDFSGNNSGSDLLDVTFSVELPANLNLQNSTNLAFDIYYVCAASGSTGKTEFSGIIPNAITFPIKVLSALQASYAGTSLAFGEIGNVTTPDVQSSPGSYRTPNTNYLRVQSSGPYQVDLTSQNGYRMTFPGGNLGDPNQRVDYSLKFLGETRSASAATGISKTCTRAGIGMAFEDHLYVQATLLEGGQSKMVSPNYSDILTVVVAPLSVPDPGLDCNAFSTP